MQFFPLYFSSCYSHPWNLQMLRVIDRTRSPHNCCSKPFNIINKAIWFAGERGGAFKCLCPRAHCLIISPRAGGCFHIWLMNNLTNNIKGAVPNWHHVKWFISPFTSSIYNVNDVLNWGVWGRLFQSCYITSARTGRQCRLMRWGHSSINGISLSDSGGQWIIDWSWEKRERKTC